MNLFNKHRPAQFEDVYQPHVTAVLKAQIAKGSHVSSYVFSGPPGTGKTTLARLMAMALLCEERKSGESEPSLTSRGSDLVRRDAHRDVDEINCATNNGVDGVRELISDRLRIAPTLGDYRIFILDEMHQLTTQAQNALLKVLEEPPEHVKFFLCTTDYQKILPAIRSRCQHHVMRKLPLKSMIELLKKVSEKEEIAFEESALSVIAETADGSARTALTILEQASVIGVTEENVRDILGRGSKNITYALLKAVAEGDRASAIALIDTANMEGRDLSSLCIEAARICLFLTNCRVKGEKHYPKDEKLAELMSLYNGNKLVESASYFLEASKQIRQNVTADLAAQVSVLKLIDRIIRLSSAK